MNVQVEDIRTGDKSSSGGKNVRLDHIVGWTKVRPMLGGAELEKAGPIGRGKVGKKKRGRGGKTGSSRRYRHKTTGIRTLESRNTAYRGNKCSKGMRKKEEKLTRPDPAPCAEHRG